MPRMRQINPATMKGPGDFDPPEYPDAVQCIECDADMGTVDDETLECPECGHVEYQEDPRIAAAEDAAWD